jgi:CheY-like chemotaxis protein
VVDDNVDAAESMALLLRVSGYDVQTAHTGPTGVETASAYLPNIVLLDIGLPGLNGYEVARSLRRNPQLKDTRLIALTGYGRESDVQLGEEAGFDAHLIKPVDLKTVLELITSL